MHEPTPAPRPLELPPELAAKLEDLQRRFQAANTALAEHRTAVRNRETELEMDRLRLAKELNELAEAHPEVPAIRKLHDDVAQAVFNDSPVLQAFAAGERQRQRLEGRGSGAGRKLSLARYLPGRNDPCPCGSGKKSKRCCLK